MASVPRTISFAVWLAVVPSAWAAEPMPQGSYQTDIWGTVKLGTEDGVLVGHPSENNPCGFATTTRVLEGNLQGRVLVGQFRLCLQETRDCPKLQVLPVLGFYSAEEGSLTAYVRPKKGCVSPVLGAEGLVVLRSPEAQEAAAERAAAGRTVKRAPQHPDPEQVKAAVARGEQLLKEKKWSASVTEFERSIFLGAKSWVAFFGLGTAQLMRNQIDDSIVNLKKAQDLNSRQPEIAYHLACAYSRRGEKKEALGWLRQSVALGYAVEPGMQDPGLEGVLLADTSSNAEYSQLLLQMFNNSQNPARARQAQRP